MGFNGVDAAAGGNAFSRETVEEDGETSYIYTLKKYHILTCQEGFTVLDAANNVSYGMNPDFEAMAPAAGLYIRISGQKVEKIIRR